jgi:dienelactone hydrolase
MKHALLILLAMIRVLSNFAQQDTSVHAGGSKTQYSKGPGATKDSLHWIRVETDSGTVHAAIALPKGRGSFHTIIILHGTHGFAKEYINLARQFAAKGFVGVAACWFRGGKGKGERFITPIDFPDAPPLVDVPGVERFRIARVSIDSLVKSLSRLPEVDSKQISLFGHSRGGGAALDYVLNNPGRVQALVLNSTGYPPEVVSRAKEVTVPVLVLHGVADSPADGGSPFTNVSQARDFEAAMKASNKDVKAYYFETSGHNALFTNPAQFEQTVKMVSTFLLSRMRM